MNELTIDSFLAYTIGIIVYFVGVNLNRRFELLRSYNIPEPVSGGLVAASATFLLCCVRRWARTTRLPY